MGEIKRVLCITSNMNTGGAETFLMKMLRNIDREKYIMDFCVSSKEEDYYANEIAELGGKIYKIHAKTENIFLYIKDLYSIIKKNKYKNVLRITSNCFGTLDLWIALIAGAKRRIVRSSNSSDGKSGMLLYAHKVFREILNSVANVKIAPSDLAAKYSFGEKSVKKNKVIYLNNGVDTKVYKYTDEKRNEIRKELEIEDKFVLAHVGRFMTQKNHKFLFDIFSELTKLKENSVLLLVGKGELEEELKKQARELGIYDKIKFLGVRSDVYAILSAADFMIFPSLYEGMPNVVIESQAAGLKSLISDTITREAKITDLTTYMPLSASKEEWAKKAVELSEKKIKNREDYIEDLKEKGYDILTSVNLFTSFII